MHTSNGGQGRILEDAREPKLLHVGVAMVTRGGSIRDELKTSAIRLAAARMASASVSSRAAVGMAASRAASAHAQLFERV
eukprot:3300502-Pleurochrysis_carterae.AAC.2